MYCRSIFWDWNPQVVICCDFSIMVFVCCREKFPWWDFSVSLRTNIYNAAKNYATTLFFERVSLCSIWPIREPQGSTWLPLRDWDYKYMSLPLLCGFWESNSSSHVRVARTLVSEVSSQSDMPHSLIFHWYLDFFHFFIAKSLSFIQNLLRSFPCMDTTPSTGMNSLTSRNVLGLFQAHVGRWLFKVSS